MGQLNVSERRVCRELNQSRSIQRYSPKIRDGEDRLIESMVDLVTNFGCYCYLNGFDAKRRLGSKS
jgi:hypothetical protein